MRWGLEVWILVLGEHLIVFGAFRDIVCHRSIHFVPRLPGVKGKSTTLWKSNETPTEMYKLVAE